MLNVYFIPSGITNLSTIFPSLNFNDIESYRLVMLDGSSTVIATSNKFLVRKACPDDIKIHFVNSLGGIDSVPFNKMGIDTDSKSDTYQKPISIPLVRSQHSINRFDIRTNDIYTVSQEFQENEMEWIKELISTPFAWIEWKGEDGEPDDYLPIVIADKRVRTFQHDERYYYNIEIDFYLSHERITP